MKTITVSDKDYETLMELSKELQTQPNHSQAFPYFWEPRSGKLEIDYHGEGKVSEVYVDGKTCDLETFAERDDFKTYKEFLEDMEDVVLFDEDSPYIKSLESEWANYISFNLTHAEIVTYNWVKNSEHNPSLFLSDVKGFIKNNTHHLGKDPHTYARTIWRMPKMEALIKAIYRIAPIQEDINQEALHTLKRD